MRKRRKKSEIPFADALEFARKRLVKAQKELEQADEACSVLRVEIPDLEATIAVLQKNLGTSKIGLTFTAAQDAAFRLRIDGGIKFASKPVDVTVPVVFEEPTEDTLLPEPEGTELLPE